MMKYIPWWWLACSLLALTVVFVTGLTIVPAAALGFVAGFAGFYFDSARMTRED